MTEWYNILPQQEQECGHCYQQANLFRNLSCVGVLCQLISLIPSSVIILPHPYLSVFITHSCPLFHLQSLSFPIHIFLYSSRTLVPYSIFSHYPSPSISFCVHHALLSLIPSSVIILPHPYLPVFITHSCPLLQHFVNMYIS